jgi:hypothetical protein
MSASMITVKRIMPQISASRASAPYQQNGQEDAGYNVEYQAKAGPPMRHARVVQEAVMNEVKNSVTYKASNCEPKTDLEGKQRHQQETRGDQGLKNHHVS